MWFELTDITLRRLWVTAKRAHKLSLAIHTKVFRGRFGWGISCALYDLRQKCRRAYFAHTPDLHNMPLMTRFVAWENEMYGDRHLNDLKQVDVLVTKVAAKNVALYQLA